MIKVMIADDQELIRESLKKIVLSTHEDIDVVDTASDGFEVLKCLEKYVVDVILMIFVCQVWMVLWLLRK